MDLLEAIILGIVQGATEFLPVSSSGHLVLVSWWLGFDSPPLVYTVVVHLGTTLAVLTYFWKDWWKLLLAGISALRNRTFTIDQNPEYRLLVLLIVGTIPAVFAGLLVAEFFDEVFSTPLLVSFNLFITAGLLIYGERATAHQARIAEAGGIPARPATLEHPTTLADALFIGFAQALAILPGISRSGSTIAAGLVRGMTRAEAARFSFLLATPIIIGAGMKEALTLITEDVVLTGDLRTALLVGFIFSAMVGYACIVFLLALIRRYGFYGFAGYCLVFGLLSLGGVLVRG